MPKVNMDLLPFTIAVDFDGCLVSQEWPKIGEKNHELFSLIKHYKKLGFRIILWTCRVGKMLDEAVEYCVCHGVEFDAVNCNIPEVQEMFGHDTRKVWAHIYIDDKNIIPPLPWKEDKK